MIKRIGRWRLPWFWATPYYKALRPVCGILDAAVKVLSLGFLVSDFELALTGWFMRLYCDVLMRKAEKHET